MIIRREIIDSGQKRFSLTRRKKKQRKKGTFNKYTKTKENCVILCVLTSVNARILLESGNLDPFQVINLNNEKLLDFIIVSPSPSICPVSLIHL